MGKLSRENLKSFLDEKAELYNRPKFIEEDPISIPHRFNDKKDIEISAFFAATIAWGQRKTIINNANKIMEIMDNAPHDFVINHTDTDLKRCKGFVHRTFNEIDLRYFLRGLKHIYQNHGGLESAFFINENEKDTSFAIHRLKKVFFEIDHPERSRKHISDPLKSSSAKRLNMFLRWMVRKDQKAVDFGIWQSIPMSKLSIPLDIHTGNVSRMLGLLERKQNDNKAVQELDKSLRKFNAKDPVKYDFALFGLGVYEGFNS